MPASLLLFLAVMTDISGSDCAVRPKNEKYKTKTCKSSGGVLRYDLFAKSGRLSDNGFPSSVVSEEKLQKHKKSVDKAGKLW